MSCTSKQNFKRKSYLKATNNDEKEVFSSKVSFSEPGCIPCIPCKAHAGGTPVAHQVYANVGGWRTPEVQSQKNSASRCGFIYASAPYIMV